mgnify:CR=1 FL=1
MSAIERTAAMFETMAGHIRSGQIEVLSMTFGQAEPQSIDTDGTSVWSYFLQIEYLNKGETK